MYVEHCPSVASVVVSSAITVVAEAFFTVSLRVVAQRRGGSAFTLWQVSSCTEQVHEEVANGGCTSPAIHFFDADELVRGGSSHDLREEGPGVIHDAAVVTVQGLRPCCAYRVVVKVSVLDERGTVVVADAQREFVLVTAPQVVPMRIVRRSDTSMEVSLVHPAEVDAAERTARIHRAFGSGTVVVLWNSVLSVHRYEARLEPQCKQALCDNDTQAAESAQIVSVEFPGQSFVAHNLQPDSVYLVSARALWEGGLWGPWSQVSHACTLPKLEVKVSSVSLVSATCIASRREPISCHNELSAVGADSTPAILCRAVEVSVPMAGSPHSSTHGDEDDLTDEVEVPSLDEPFTLSALQPATRYRAVCTYSYPIDEQDMEAGEAEFTTEAIRGRAPTRTSLGSDWDSMVIPEGSLVLSDGGLQPVLFPRNCWHW